MECVIHREKTGEGEEIDCRQADGGCEVTWSVWGY
ncbi:hypothetical protein EDD92_8453 [Streptomyces sp. TLI_185]|nr:hypothetical protein EDD92_8453 [Streptomyces sp. TLI_185]